MGGALLCGLGWHVSWGPLPCWAESGVELGLGSRMGPLFVFLPRPHWFYRLVLSERKVNSHLKNLWLKLLIFAFYTKAWPREFIACTSQGLRRDLCNMGSWRLSFISLSVNLLRSLTLTKWYIKTLYLLASFCQSPQYPIGKKTTLKDLYINFEKLLLLIIVILHLPQVFLSGKSKHTVKSQETKIREEKSF